MRAARTLACRNAVLLLALAIACPPAALAGLTETKTMNTLSTTNRNTKSSRARCGASALGAAALGVALAASAVMGCGSESDGDGGEGGSSMVALGGAGMGGAGLGGAGGAGMGGAGGAGMVGAGALQFPVGFQDWPVIGIVNRTELGLQPDGITPRDAGIRVVVGNARAVAAARAGTVATWPEGSILVGVVWSDAGNPREPLDMFAPGEFRFIQVMEKSSSRFAATGNWGYGVWESDGRGIAPRASDTDCFGCHNERVADKDYVFTRPLDMPSAAEVAAAGLSPDGVGLPLGFTEWRFVAVHQRIQTPQMRVVLGNDIAIEAVRAGTTNPWPDGTMLADIISPVAQNPAWPELVEPGDRAAVAFMQRDSTRFAAQGNWGYGIWRGADELAAGDDVSACVNCHVSTPGVPENDYVFTAPAALPVLP